MATYTVTRTDDSGPGSLRQAVADANARPGADEIVFDAAVFDGGADDLIRLTSGQIDVTDDLTIRGGPAGVTITGDALGDDVTLAGGITDVAASLAGEDRLDDNSRIFDATRALTLEGLTLTGGRTTAIGEEGGAVRAAGDLTLNGVTLAGNSTAGANAEGGGVCGVGARSVVTVAGSTVWGNSTAGEGSRGGGVAHAGYRGSLTLTGSTVSGNSTTGYLAHGGGVFGSDIVTLIDSTVSGNGAPGRGGRGGGVDFGHALTLTGSTVSGNSAAAFGGGVCGGGEVLALTSSTIARNAASAGGGVAVRGFTTATLTSSIVAENGGGDLLALAYAAFLSGGDNLIGDGSGGGAFVNGGRGDIVGTALDPVDPLLGPLAPNGGPTKTHALLPGSPAIDAGANPLGLAFDQRGPGFPRERGPQADIGAVESAPPPLPIFTETESNNAFSLRNAFTTPDGALVRAALGPAGIDRDFFALRGFAPRTKVVVAVEDDDPATVLGAVDRRGTLTAVDDSAADGVSRLVATADAHGAVRVAVGGFDDFDFDGRSDATGGRHGRSGAYALVVSLAAETRAGVARARDDADQTGCEPTRVALRVLTTGDRPEKTVGLRFEGLDTSDDAVIADAYIRFQASRRIAAGGEIAIAIEDGRDAASFARRGPATIAARDYLDETMAWKTTATALGGFFRTPNLAPLLDALLGGDDVDPGDAFAFKLSGPGRIDAWSSDGEGAAPALVIVYAAPAETDGLDPLGLG